MGTDETRVTIACPDTDSGISKDPPPLNQTLPTHDEDASGNVRFDGSWSLAGAQSDKPLLSRHLHLSEHAASPSYGDQVSAMSRTLGKLTDNIAEAIPMAERASGRAAIAHAPR